MGKCSQGVDKIVESTKKKIDRIIDEIENGETKYQKSDKLTTDEVVKILLGERIDESEYIGLRNSNSLFDMEELERWRKRNNQLYEVVYDREIDRHWKRFGWFERFIKRIVRKMLRPFIKPLCKEQSEFNGSVTASINTLRNNEVVTQDMLQRFDIEINGLRTLIEKYKNEINRVMTELSQISERTSVLQQEIEKRDTKFQHGFDEQYSFIKSRLQDIEEMNRRLIREVENRNLDRNDGSEFLCNRSLVDAAILNSNEKNNNIDVVQTAEGNKNDKNTNGEDTDNIYDEIDYYDFENHFRGSRESIKERQSIYIPYYKKAEFVLDIGCGRGEFLELLQENQIPALGIDLYQEYVDVCSFHGLNAICGDGLDYLSKQETASLGGIFACQVVEHLTTHQIIRLCKEAYRVLKPGGYYIVETPNPICLGIFRNSFYVDPTHKQPIHPSAMEYYLQKSGFEDTKILFTEGSKSEYKLPILQAENVKNLKQFNDGINALSDSIWGSHDYAIIAKKN